MENWIFLKKLLQIYVNQEQTIDPQYLLDVIDKLLNMEIESCGKLITASALGTTIPKTTEYIIYPYKDEEEEL